MAAYGSVRFARRTRANAASGRPPARRAQILAQAAEIFGERGYLRTSLEDIATSLGITREALYHHFRNKNQIFLEIMMGPSEALLKRLKAILRSRTTSLQKLTRAVDNHVSFFMPTYLDMIIALREDHELSNDRSFAKLRAIEREYNACWIALVREGRRRGEFRRQAPEKVVVFAILGMCNWLARWFDPDKDLRPEHIASIFADLALFGLAQKAPESRKTTAPRIRSRRATA